MNSIIFPFIITFFSGLSTIFGMIPCFFRKKYSDFIIPFSLSFAGGVMITISFLSLIPETFILLNSIFYLIPTLLVLFLLIVLGVVFSSSIDSLIEKKFKNNLYRLGIISVIVLVLHNIPEGITTFISTSYDLSLGIKLSIAILLHNIPEGISIAVPIYYSTNNLFKAFLYTLIAGFSEIFGAFISYLFIAQYINNLILSLILAITAGIMIHISFCELIPNSLEYKKNKPVLIGFILGIFIMSLCEILF